MIPIYETIVHRFYMSEFDFVNWHIYSDKMLLERDYESVILIYDLHLVFTCASKRTLLYMHINIQMKILSVLLFL